MTRPRRLAPVAALAGLAMLASCSGSDELEMISQSGKVLVAHRGASAYAPEHTLAAYELAIEQGADYIEPDLQVTSDGVLIALHDLTLERTTDVEDLFPDRYRTEYNRNGVAVRRWYAIDFTLEEIKQLDAGSWFDSSFAGERVPTLREVIDLARGRAGIFPETKAPEVYGDEGFDMEHLLAVELTQHGLHVQNGVTGTPVALQSFSLESLRILRHEHHLDLPSTFLVSTFMDGRRWFRPEGFAEILESATGIGPNKDLLLALPGTVEAAHEAGLTVVPYTFGDRDPEQFDEVLTETRYFLYNLGVDGLFTNNPDLFPRGS